MRGQAINDLFAFLAVAREKSFTRAAAQLGVSQSALSHAMRSLETRLGVRLLTRTTRRVAPTEAGDRLLQSIGPKFEEIQSELTALNALREKPGGTIRITAAQHATEAVLWPKIAKLLPKYPDLKVEIMPTHGNIYAWEFEKGSKELKVRVDGQLVFNRMSQIIEGALAGFGFAYVPEDAAAPQVAKGRLVRVLEDWCAPFPGYHLYYPSRRQNAPAFALLVEALRYKA